MVKDYEEIFRNFATQLSSPNPYVDEFEKIFDNLFDNIELLIRKKDWNNLEKIKVMYETGIIIDEGLRRFIKLMHQYALFRKTQNKDLIRDLLSTADTLPAILRSAFWHALQLDIFPDLPDYLPPEELDIIDPAKKIERSGMKVKIMDDNDFVKQMWLTLVSKIEFNLRQSGIDIPKDLKRKIGENFQILVRYYLQDTAKVKKRDERYKEVWYRVMSRLHDEFPEVIDPVTKDDIIRDWTISKVAHDLHSTTSMHKQDLDEQLLKAKEYMHRRNFKEARKCFQKVLEKFPRTREAKYGLGIAHRMEENFHESLTCFKEMVEENPEDVEALIQVATILIQEGVSSQIEAKDGIVLQEALKLQEEGISYLEKALHIAPDNGLILQTLIESKHANWYAKFSAGEIPEKEYLKKQKLLLEAQKVFVRPSQVPSEKLTQLLSERKRVSKLKEFYQKISAPVIIIIQDEVTQDEADWMAKGQTLIKAKEFEKASSCYERVTEINPENAEAWFRLGVTCAMTGEKQSGAPIYNELTPIGHQYNQRALGYFEKVVTLDPDSLQAWELILDLCEKNVFYRANKGLSIPKNIGKWQDRRHKLNMRFYKLQEEPADPKVVKKLSADFKQLYGEYKKFIKMN